MAFDDEPLEILESDDEQFPELAAGSGGGPGLDLVGVLHEVAQSIFALARAVAELPKRQ